MEAISNLFELVAKVGAGLALLAIIVFVIYLRWRAAGQERGI